MSDGYDLFLILVINILDSNLELLVVGNLMEFVEKVFGKMIVNNWLSLLGVVLCKK